MLVSDTRLQIPGPQFWFHDLGSCLHDCFGTILLHHRRDPVEALGASWAFYHRSEDMREEEFYYPELGPSLGDSMFPFHPVDARWRSSNDFATAWTDIRVALGEGRLVLAAVDNFFMPIRPAFGDVHAAHLVVVSGFDDESQQVFVLENTPPLFHGPIPMSDFERARTSENSARSASRDYFFAGSPIENRWIDVHVGSNFERLTRDRVGQIVSANLKGFTEGGRGGNGLHGLAGLQAFLRGATTDDTGLSAIYSAGWTAQSEAALHADFLMQSGRRLDWDELAEVGRTVDRIANDWTAVRVIAAHMSTRSVDKGAELDVRISRLIAAYERAIEALEFTVLKRGGTTPASRGRPVDRPCAVVTNDH